MKGYQMMKKDYFQQKLKIIQLKRIVSLFYQLKWFWTEKFILEIKLMIVGVIPIFSDSFQEENDLNEHHLKDFMNWEIDRLVFIYLVMKGDNTHYFMIYKSFNWNSVSILFANVWSCVCKNRLSFNLFFEFICIYF